MDWVFVAQDKDK